ncbi:MAG: hypothetical protein M1401_08650 [Chloroflexi bacterium]|nr:hypothetical protein [Chloroflexota bacterium]
MPGWSPLEVGLLFGIACASLWTARNILKHHRTAGFWMVIEARFWRSLVVNFVAVFTLGGLLGSLLATVIWLLVRLADFAL